MLNVESIYRLLFENSGQGMVLRQGEKILLVNQSFAEMIGYRIEELLAFSVDDILKMMHPQDREAVVGRYYDLLAGKELPKQHEYRLISRTGEVVWVAATVTKIEDDDQPAVLGIYEDITERRGTQEAFDRGRQLLLSTLDVLPVGVCLTDEEGYYRLMNDSYCAIYEFKREEMIGKHYSVIMPPDQVELANAHYARLLTGDVGIPVERKRQRKDGSIVYIEAANALVNFEDGTKMVITTVRDISERKQRDEIVHMRLRLLEFATTHSTDALINQALDEIENLTSSPVGFYAFVNEEPITLAIQACSTRTEEIYWSQEGVILADTAHNQGLWIDCIHKQAPVIYNHPAPLFPCMRKVNDATRQLLAPVIRDGHVVALLGIGDKSIDYTETDSEWSVYIADLIWTIVERKKTDDQIRQLNTKLEYLAMRDELTGLPNRRAFFLQGAKEIEKAHRYAMPFSFLLLDLDSFKAINDTYGHAAGDFALRRFANILSENIRDMDLAARMGGDEFSLLLPDTEPHKALTLAQRIQGAVERENLHLDDIDFHMTVSIGVAGYGANASTLETIMKQADDCMYQAKNQGRNRVVAVQ